MADNGKTNEGIHFYEENIVTIYHQRLPAHVEDNCLKCGWCTSSFKRCFPCIMQDHDEESKKKNWRKLLNYPKFKAAADARWQDIQVHFLAEMNGCMSNTRVLHMYKFHSVENFKNFLLVTRSEQVLAEIFTIEKKPSEIHHAEWKCVGYYCMTILSALVTPLDAEGKFQYDFNFFKQSWDTANRISKYDGVLKKLLGYLDGSHDLVELIRASSALTCFAGASPDVTQKIADIANWDTLVNLFSAGTFNKMAGKRREKPYPRYVKVLLALAIKDVFDDVDPDRLDEDECFKRCRRRGYNVLENAGQLLYNIASLNKTMATKVFETPGFQASWMKWLRQPILLKFVDQNTTGQAANLLHTFVQNRVLAKCLVEEKNLLVLLERLLFIPHDYPLDIYVSCVKNLLSHGNVFMDRIVRHEHIIFAVGCYVHCPVQAIRDQAMSIIATLYKLKPHVIKYLNAKGIITHGTMYRYTDSRMWNDDVVTWSTLICQRAKRTLAHRWSMNTQDMAKPDDREKFTWEKMKEEGNRHFQHNNFEEALRWYRSGVMIAPNRRHQALLHSNSAECYLRQNRYGETVRECTLALSAAFCQSPVYVKTLFRRAKAFYQLGRPFEALGDISVCLWSKPDDEKFKELHEDILKDYKKIPDAVYKLHECDECNWVGEGLKKCAQCMKLYFCSGVCQRRAWPRHKLSCGRERRVDNRVSDSCDRTCEDQHQLRPRNRKSNKNLAENERCCSAPNCHFRVTKSGTESDGTSDGSGTVSTSPHKSSSERPYSSTVPDEPGCKKINSKGVKMKSDGIGRKCGKFARKSMPNDDESENRNNRHFETLTRHKDTKRNGRSSKTKGASFQKHLPSSPLRDSSNQKHCVHQIQLSDGDEEEMLSPKYDVKKRSNSKLLYSSGEKVKSAIKAHKKGVDYSN